MPGNALSVAPGSPFAELQRFGNALLGRFVGSMVHSPVLRHLTLVDTPGVLSGKEEQLQRGFDFAQVGATRSLSLSSYDYYYYY